MSLKGHLHARSESPEEKVSKTIYCPRHIDDCQQQNHPVCAQQCDQMIGENQPVFGKSSQKRLRSLAMSTYLHQSYI
jgi:hypothetical protein